MNFQNANSASAKAKALAEARRKLAGNGKGLLESSGTAILTRHE
jgi:hypothetical protein